MLGAAMALRCLFGLPLWAGALVEAELLRRHARGVDAFWSTVVSRASRRSSVVTVHLAEAVREARG